MVSPRAASPRSASLLLSLVAAVTARLCSGFCALGYAGSSCTGRLQCPTMTAHHRHLPHDEKSGVSGSTPIITATGKAAPPPRPTPSKASGDDSSSSSSSRKRRRRRRPTIGPAVWAAFKEEQRGVTRTLLGLPDEDDKNPSKKNPPATPTSAAAAAAGKDGDESDGPIEKEPRRRQQQEQEKKRRQSLPPRTTLGTFMADTRSRSPDMEAMVPIMKSVGKTCIAVSRLVRRAQIEGMAGLHQDGDANANGTGGGAGSSVNVQGEVQKELDVLSNSIFLTGFCQPADMSCVASEEEEAPRMCAAVVGEETHGGEYAAVFDPLDGSANIEAGLPCGTIFGILRVSGSAREGRKAGPSTIVLPGRRLVAAGYCLYGPSTKLVFTLGAGVFEFTLQGEGGGDGEEGGGGGGLGGGGLEFVLTRSNMRIPRRGHIYSVNEANSVSWSEAIQDYFRDIKTTMATSTSPSSSSSSSSSSPSSDDGGGGEDEKAVEVEGQYAGALVADIHNVLVHGGVFAYPADVRNPNGKLRLLYEGNPMAMIVEQAGGIATTGFEAIRDVRPQSVHHRIPAFFGSPDDLLPLLNPRYLHSKDRR